MCQEMITKLLACPNPDHTVRLGWASCSRSLARPDQAYCIDGHEFTPAQLEAVRNNAHVTPLSTCKQCDKAVIEAREAAREAAAILAELQRVAQANERQLLPSQP
jgi:hypothetical protein